MDGWWANAPLLKPAETGALFFGNAFLIGQDWSHFFEISRGDSSLHLMSAQIVPEIECRSFLIVPQAWTLGLELTFYFLAPLIVRRSTTTIGALAGASILSRYIGRHMGRVGPPWDYRFFPFELGLFLVGVLAYRLYLLGAPRGWFNGIAAKAAAGSLFLLVVTFKFWSGPQVAGLPVAYLGFALLLPALFHITKDIYFDRWFGEYSFLIYLVHLVLIVLIVKFVPAAHGTLRIVVFIPMLIIACWALRRWVDDPVAKWRQRRFGS